MSKPTEQWHVSKSINLGHVLTTVGMVVALFFFVNDFDDRVDLLEYKQAVSERAAKEEREYVKSLFSLIRQDLNYIRKRIDNANKGK